jgi:hypothetical protein
MPPSTYGLEVTCTPGDIGVISPGGELVIDRIKDVIKTGGRMGLVAPA